MGGDQLPALADVEVYPDESAAIRALQEETPVPLTGSVARPPLPELASAAGSLTSELSRGFDPMMPRSRTNVCGPVSCTPGWCPSTGETGWY